MNQNLRGAKRMTHQRGPDVPSEKEREHLALLQTRDTKLYRIPCSVYPGTAERSLWHLR